MKPYRAFKVRNLWFFFDNRSKELIAVGFSIEHMWENVAICMSPVRTDPGPLRAL